MELHEGGVAQTGGCTAGIGEEEGGLVRFAVDVQSMMGDGPANHLVLRGNGLPGLGWRQDGRRIDHGAVLQQNGA